MEAAQVDRIQVDHSVDDITVGGGTAGCVLANRLSADDLARPKPYKKFSLAL